MIRLEQVPRCMKEIDTWMTSNCRCSPCDSNGFPISNKYPNHMTFEDALMQLESSSALDVKYISNALYNNFVCIDLDDCFNEDYQLYSWAYEIVQELRNYKCYMEISKSGKGLHIFFRCGEFINRKSLSYQLSKYHQEYEKMKGKIEIFCNNKNIIITGDVYLNKTYDELDECPIWIFEFYDSLSKKLSKNVIDKKYNVDKSSDNVYAKIKSMLSIETILEYYNIEIDEHNNINCPFDDHEDNNPSMKVYFYSNSFNCFGCQKAGSIIDFVMAKEKITAWKAAIFINKTFDLNLDMTTLVEWSKDYCKVTQNGIVPILTIANLKILLNKYDYQLKYNMMNRKVEINGQVITDAHETQIRELCIKHRFAQISKDCINSILNCIAEENKYHPMKSYFDNLKIQKKHENLSTLNTLFETLIYQDVHNDIQFNNALIKKWLMNAYKAIYDEEFISQGVLTLQGEQSIGKTTWLKHLCPLRTAFQSEFTGLDVNNKDSVNAATMFWMTELSELESTFKKDFVALKGFLTRPIDIYRLPFARRPMEAPRRTVFAASVNSLQFLRDDTGDRRFWILSVESIDLDLMKSINLDDLWCEIKYLVDIKKESHYLDKDQNKKLMATNKEFTVLNDIDSILLELISDEKLTAEELRNENVNTYSSEDIAKIIRYYFTGVKNVTNTSIGRALQKLNLSQKKKNYKKNKRSRRTTYHWFKLNPEYNLNHVRM
jgi:putative DNA primase/helicase